MNNSPSLLIICKGVHLEADLSTEQYKKKKDFRFSNQDEHKGRKGRPQPKEGKRKKEAGCLVVSLDVLSVPGCRSH